MKQWIKKGLTILIGIILIAITMTYATAVELDDYERKIHIRPGMSIEESFMVFDTVLPTTIPISVEEHPDYYGFPQMVKIISQEKVHDQAFLVTFSVTAPEDSGLGVHREIIRVDDKILNVVVSVDSALYYTTATFLNNEISLFDRDIKVSTTIIVIFLFLALLVGLLYLGRIL